MNIQIQNLNDFIACEENIGKKTVEYIDRVGWEEAKEVLAETLEVAADAREEIIEILENEDFEKWFQLGLRLNSKDYVSYSVLGIEEIAIAIRKAYENKDLMREVFNNKLKGFKEAQGFPESLRA